MSSLKITNGETNVPELIAEAFCHLNAAIIKNSNSEESLLNSNISIAIIVIHNGKLYYSARGKQCYIFMKKMNDIPLFKGDIDGYTTKCIWVYKDIEMKELMSLSDVVSFETPLEEGERILLCTQTGVESLGIKGLLALVQKKNLHGCELMSSIVNSAKKYGRGHCSAILIDIS